MNNYHINIIDRDSDKIVISVMVKAKSKTGAILKAILKVDDTELIGNNIQFNITEI